MEKIAKNKNKNKTKTSTPKKKKRPNRHTSVKTEFFFPRLRAVPYIFLKSGTPSPQIRKCLKLHIVLPGFVRTL